MNEHDRERLIAINGICAAMVICHTRIQNVCHNNCHDDHRNLIIKAFKVRTSPLHKEPMVQYLP